MLTMQLYTIQLLYKPHLITWILQFGLLGKYLKWLFGVIFSCFHMQIWLLWRSVLTKNNPLFVIPLPFYFKKNIKILSWMWSLLSCNLSNLVPLYLIFHNRYCHSVRQQLFQWRNNLEYRWPTGFYSWSYISPGLCERVFRKWQLHRLYLVWECWVGSIVEFLKFRHY